MLKLTQDLNRIAEKFAGLLATEGFCPVWTGCHTRLVAEFAEIEEAQRCAKWLHALTGRAVDIIPADADCGPTVTLEAA